MPAIRTSLTVSNFLMDSLPHHQQSARSGAVAAGNAVAGESIASNLPEQATAIAGAQVTVSETPCNESTPPGAGALQNEANNSFVMNDCSECLAGSDSSTDRKHNDPEKPSDIGGRAPNERTYWHEDRVSAKLGLPIDRGARRTGLHVEPRLSAALDSAHIVQDFLRRPARRKPG